MKEFFLKREAENINNKQSKHVLNSIIFNGINSGI